MLRGQPLKILVKKRALLGAGEGVEGLDLAGLRGGRGGGGTPEGDAPEEMAGLKKYLF